MWELMKDQIFYTVDHYSDSVFALAECPCGEHTFSAVSSTHANCRQLIRRKFRKAHPEES